MSMNISVIKSSFELAKPISADLVDYFYKYMFENFAEVKPLFANVNMPKQKQALIHSLVYIVDHLTDLPTLTQYLKSMGARHSHYQVTEEHYTIVGKSLIASFKFFFGRDWTPELEDQWINAYQFIAETMMAGASEQRQKNTSEPKIATLIPSSDNLQVTAKKMAKKILADALESAMDEEFKQLIRKKVQNYLVQALHEEAALMQAELKKKAS